MLASFSWRRLWTFALNQAHRPVPFRSQRSQWAVGLSPATICATSCSTDWILLPCRREKKHVCMNCWAWHSSTELAADEISMMVPSAFSTREGCTAAEPSGWVSRTSGGDKKFVIASTYWWSVEAHLHRSMKSKFGTERRGDLCCNETEERMGITWLPWVIPLSGTLQVSTTS